VDCCAPKPAATRACPSCGASGRRVKRATLDALVVDPPPASPDHRFCAAPGCPVAYFSDAGTVPTSAVRVRIGQKETAADRPLCYCFGHAASDVVEEVRATGSSTIPARIAERCKRGEDRCAETNPQGSCCLGNVRVVLKQAQREAATVASCCGHET